MNDEVLVGFAHGDGTSSEPAVATPIPTASFGLVDDNASSMMPMLPPAIQDVPELRGTVVDFAGLIAGAPVPPRAFPLVDLFAPPVHAVPEAIADMLLAADAHGDPDRPIMTGRV